MNYTHYISIDPTIRFGKPCINGSRISVYDVLSWLASGLSVDQILSDYPELKEVEIQACLAFAADRENRIRIAS